MSRGLPSMTALLGLLAVAGFQNRDKLAEMFGGGSQNDPQAGGTGLPNQMGGSTQAGGQQGGLGGMLSGLGGLLGGAGAGTGAGAGAGAGAAGAAGAGGILSGGLSDLMDRFRQSGHGDVAESWVKPGPNREVAPDQLEQAIGPEVLASLTQHTGLSREELLARLSKELPNAVDQYTPDGRLPA